MCAVPVAGDAGSRTWECGPAGPGTSAPPPTPSWDSGREFALGLRPSPEPVPPVIRHTRRARYGYLSYVAGRVRGVAKAAQSTDPHLDWITSFARYVSTVQTGGTPEQRAWAWAHANVALDALMAFELAELRGRAKSETQEMEAA